MLKKYIFWGMILFIISLMVGYFYGQRIFEGTALVENTVISDDKINEEKDEIVPTSYEDIKILPSTKLGLRKLYKDCNHTSFEFVELPSELINKSKEEVEKKYGDWKVEEFFANKVILYKEVPGICDEHFFLTLGEQFVEIYKLTDKENKILYQNTNISREYLTEQDILKPENGISLYGIGQLNSTIEDFE